MINVGRAVEYAADYRPPVGEACDKGSRRYHANLFCDCVLRRRNHGGIDAVDVAQRNATSNSPIRSSPAVDLEPTPAQDLARIREVLKPRVLELANLFGVSRQAVYAWQEGARPAAKVAAGLAQLARAADVFAAADVQVDARTLRRKVMGGRTVLDAVLVGDDASQIAQSLVQTLRREAAQREMLKMRFAGRRREAVDLSDYGTPAATDDA